MANPFLTELDIELLKVLSGDLLFATTTIVSILFPATPARTIRHRIRKLLERKFLSRRLYPSSYPVPKLSVYFAGPQANTALSQIPSESAFLAHRKRAIYMKDSAIPHCLLIQTAHARFLAQTRDPRQSQLLTWIPSYDGIWTKLHDYGFMLNPDAYLELRIEGVICPFFLEMDAGTERGANLKAKFQAYHDYAASGIFQNHFSAPSFRVLFITTTPRRIQHLAPILARYDPHLFWLAPHDDFISLPILNAYWITPPSDTALSLTAPN